MIRYASPEEARAAVVAAASGEVGKADSVAYWRGTTIHGPPWSLDWSGPFALWCLRQAQLVDWTWRIGSGFLFRLPMVYRDVLSVARPGDLTYLPEPLDRHAVIGAIDPDAVALYCGCGKGGRVTMTRSTPSALRNVAPIGALINQGDPTK